MSGLEICLIVIGLICVVCSFIFSEHLASGDIKDGLSVDKNMVSVTEEIVKRQVEAEVANIIDDKVEQMEIRVDKITTQKIMALGDYYEDINKKINESHDEVMFLYNMLNDKEETLKNTVRDIEAVKVSVKNMNTKSKDAEKSKMPLSSENKSASQTDNGVTGVYGNNTKKTVSNASSEEKNKEKNTNMGNNNQKILDMHAQGKTIIEIAKELGLGVGEVRLVVDLFNSR